MIIAFKNKSLHNFYSKKENRLFSDVSDHWIPLHKELGYPVTTLDKVKGKYIYYDNVRKYSHDIIKNNEFKLLFIESLKNRDDIRNIRKMVANNNFTDFTELFRLMYDEVENFAGDKVAEAIAEISTGLYQDVLVPDKEINFIATVSNTIRKIQ